MAGMSVSAGASSKKGDLDGVDGLRQQVIDKVDVMASEVSTSTESTLNNLIDLKTRLHNDNNRMEQATETV